MQQGLRKTLRRLVARPQRRPQLMMWFPGDSQAVRAAVPPGYALRGLEEGDESAWCQLLNVNGELGAWDSERVRKALYPGLVVSAQTFVTWRGALVACAGLYDRKLYGLPAWEIGWVACHPRHRGAGLGRQAAAGALVGTRELPPRPIFLRTDDCRIPAVRAYLRLGFVPDCTRQSDVQRWVSLLRSLPEPYAQWAAQLPACPW